LNGASNTSTVKVLDKFNYKFNIDYDNDDIKVIQYVTALVSYRAALLVSICTSELLKRMTENDVTVAVDGSVYKHHPRLKIWMVQLIKQLSPEKTVSNADELGERSNSCQPLVTTLTSNCFLSFNSVPFSSI